MSDCAAFLGRTLCLATNNFSRILRYYGRTLSDDRRLFRGRSVYNGHGEYGATRLAMSFFFTFLPKGIVWNYEGDGKARHL